MTGRRRFDTKQIALKGKCRQTVSRALTCLVCTVIMFASVGRATASDIDALSEILSLAYEADQIVFLCARDNKNFANQTKGPKGYVRDYVRHIETEVLSDLSPENAKRVKIGALNAARSIVRQQLKSLSASYPNIPVDVVQKWCGDAGTGIIHDLIRKHDADHLTFLKEIEDAKRPSI